MTMAELLAIGFPPLPVGMFYRVTSDRWGRVTLQTRKKLRFGSLCEDEVYTYPRNFDPPLEAPELFLYLAEKMKEENEKIDARIAYWRELEKYEGDHK